MQCGTGGTPFELVVNGNGGHVAWDSDLSDGLDSGTFGVQLSSSGGGSSLSVVKAAVNGSASDNSVAYSTIQRVEVIASVAGTRRKAQWSAVAVNWYRNGVLVQSLTRPPECQPKADTYVVPTVSWQGVEYTPPSGDIDSVVITGQIRLQAAAPILNAWEVMGKVLIFAANCAPR